MQTAGMDKTTRLTTLPVRKLILSMAAPNITIMLIATLYNMTDTYFVGQLGTSATAGVGVAFSLMMLLQALGFLFGQGSGNYISRRLGARDIEAVSRMAATGFVTAFLVGLLITIVGLLRLESLALMLGSTETILPYAMDYLRFVLLGAPWMTSSLALNNILRFQGSPGYGMVGMVTGTVLGIGFTPLFIFVFGMGISGAGLSTAIGKMVSCVILFIGCRRGENIPIRIKNFSPSFFFYKEIIRGGLPSLFRQGLASVSIAVFNHTAATYGDAAIAAMTIANQVALLASSVVIGFGQAFQPVAGFNYGAKRYDRVISAFWFCVKLSTVFLVVVSIICMLFAPQIIHFFRDDMRVVEIGAPALRILSLALPLVGFFTTAGMMLQTIGKAAHASTLAASRHGIFILGYLLILPRFFGLLGIQLSQPMADMSSFLLSIPLTIGVLREMKKAWEERETQPEKPAQS